MAHAHAKSYQELDAVQVVAGVDPNESQLNQFCDTYRIEQRFLSVEDALSWGEFEAASNVTPDNIHYCTSIPLIESGKHVLCEKPLAGNYQEAQKMAELAAQKGIVHAINLSYREVPAMQHAAQLVASGSIGPVRHFEASYLQSWLTQAAWGDWRTESKWLCVVCTPLIRYPAMSSGSTL